MNQPNLSKDDELDEMLQQIFTHSYPTEANPFEKSLKEAKTRLIQWGKRQQEEAVLNYRDNNSTNGRPLSAPPEIIRQPVPCTGCGVLDYADWTLWPHQVYNTVLAGGVGHYCLPCFSQLVETHRFALQRDSQKPTLHDIASPNPSPAANKAIQTAMEESAKRMELDSR